MKTVFVIGAGPAGLFAAQKIAQAGHQVVVFNRDIKPGGLAEYGIYPTKDKMKLGLRKQFAKVLSLPNVHYFGHVSVGENGCLSIQELQQFGPCAIVFAVGAQGTKKLDLEGGSARGVYSAKDFVYFYNQLPPFSSQDFTTGKRVAVIGMGNVAVDIVRWLLVDAPEKADEVIVVARRGPFEAKFDLKEFEHIEMFLDRDAFQRELARIAPKLAAVEQDVTRVSEDTFPVLAKAPEPAPYPSRLLFRFLSSPAKIHVGPNGRISRLTVAENILQKKGESISCRTTDQTADLDVDTMIFAIGDVADPTIGLPYRDHGYLVNLNAADPEQPVYEICDPQQGCAMAGIYVVGWARKASEGLVGIARHDGEKGAEQVLKYVECTSDKLISPDKIRKYIEAKGIRIVDKNDLEFLARAEEEQARQLGLPRFKFSDDDSMFRVIDEKSKTVAV